MEVRRLTHADLDDYFALRLEMLQDSPDAFLVTHDEEKERGSGFFGGVLRRADPDNAIFGAYHDGHLVGAAGVYREDHRAKILHKAILWGMYVQPGARGRGAGAELVAAVVGHAKGPMRAGALYLTVDAENTKARALYERMGFRLWGTEPKATFLGGVFRSDHHLWRDLAD